MFQAGTDQALDDQITRPRAAVPTAPGFSFMDLVKSPIQGLGGAGAKTLAFGAEITGAFGQVAGAYPELMGPITLSGEQKKQAEAQRRQLLTVGIDYSNEAGDIFRQRARDIMPDPQTTHASAQIVAGLTEFMTQAIGYTATMGPAGALLLGADVGLSESDRLKAQGVDLATRTKAGAVAGVVAGGSVVVPMSGATALTRFAKGAGVGEASMIGQSAAEKAILQHAGYDKIADTFDPLDPVMLAMGLVPGVLGAKFGKPRAPVVLKNEADMRAAAVLEPERAALEAQQESSASNLRELERAVAAEKNPKNRAALQAELDHQRTVAAAVRDNPELVSAARVQQTAMALERSRLTPVEDLAGADAHVRAVETAMDQIGRGERVDVGEMALGRIPALEEFMASTKVPRDVIPPEVNGNFIGWVGRMGGIDFAQKLDITNERGGLTSNPGGIFRKSGLGLDDLALQAEAAGYLKPGEGQESKAFVDLIKRAVAGEKVLTFEEQMAKAGRDSYMDGMTNRLQNVEGRLRSIGIDPTPAGGRLGLLEAYAREHEPALLSRALAELADAGRAAEFESSPPPPALPSRAEPAIERAKLALSDMEDSAKPIAQFIAEHPLDPEVKNLLIGMEKADEAGRARLLGDFDRMARADQKTPLMDLAADAVEGQAKKTPEQSAVEIAAQQVEALNPDMLVQLDGMDGPMRVSDLMKRIKEEAATDAEEAQLIQAAVECALRN